MWFGEPTQFTGPNINDKCKQIILHIVTFNINFYNMEKKKKKKGCWLYNRVSRTDGKYADSLLWKQSAAHITQ